MQDDLEFMTEEQFDEAAGEKDACYHKVKSRYSVWPSAYASGALVKCRKVGAKNWGNKTKKEEVDRMSEQTAMQMSPQEIALQKKKAMLDNQIAQKRKQSLNKIKKEEFQFSNWRDEFKATEFEFIDLIKPKKIGEDCWDGYEKKGMKTMFGKRYPNCVKKKKKK